MLRQTISLARLIGATHSFKRVCRSTHLRVYVSTLPHITVSQQAASTGAIERSIASAPGLHPHRIRSPHVRLTDIRDLPLAIRISENDLKMKQI